MNLNRRKDKFLLTHKEIKFPKFDKNNLKKFYEGCLNTYKEYWDKIFNQEISDVSEREFNKEDMIRVAEVLKETDHKEVASLIGSYARLIYKETYPFTMKDPYTFRFVTNCWCCVGVRNDYWTCSQITKDPHCPARAFCYSERLLRKFDLARHIVVSQCMVRGFSEVTRWLPRVDEEVKRLKMEHDEELNLLINSFSDILE